MTALRRLTVITVHVTQADIDAARPMGWCCTTGDPVARAVCRLFRLPLGSVSVGIDRIEVFDGDAGDHRHAGTYLLDGAGEQYIARYDQNRRAARPTTFTARLDTTTKMIATKEMDHVSSIALAESAACVGAALIDSPAL